MKIAIVAPRGVVFSPQGATSIDLCIHDFVTHSAYRATTTIIAPHVEAPFPGLDFIGIRTRRLSARRAAPAIARLAPDLIICHQHIPTAANLARRFAPVPVLLHRHNVTKWPANLFKRLVHQRRLAPLAGFVHCSHFAADLFARNWAEKLPKPVRSIAIHNGLDFSAWHPAPSEKRRKHLEILVVGHMHPQKGMIEAAGALRHFLPENPGWRATIVCPGGAAHPRLATQLADILGSIGPQVTFHERLRFEEVKRLNERATIAIIPSRWDEAFGRTALEAQAGGAILIARPHGGLGEVTGPHATRVDEISAASLAAALTDVAGNLPKWQHGAEQNHAFARARFDIGKIAQRLDSLYEELCRQRAS